MTRRFLLSCLLLSAGSWAIACSSSNNYPGLFPAYDAGTQGSSSGGGSRSEGGSDGGDGAISDGRARDAARDGSGGDTKAPHDGTTPPTLCPTGAALFAVAETPQTITLDPGTAYWTGAPPPDGGTGPSSAGVVQELTRGASSGVPNNIVTGLTAPLIITNASQFLGFGTLGTGGMTGSVGLYGESAMTSTTPGASLDAPAGVAIDATNVYWLANSSAGVIVESATLAGGAAVTLGTAAGSYVAGGLSVSAGTLYFAAAQTPAPTGGAIFTLAVSGGTPTALQSFTAGSPGDVRTDATNVYWSDTGAGGVYSSALAGGAITTLATGLGKPQYLAVDANNVYTADSSGGGIYEMAIGSSGSPKKLVTATNPIGVAADDTNTLVYFTADAAICTVAK